jgi:hypothetical protein
MGEGKRLDANLRTSGVISFGDAKDTGNVRKLPLSRRTGEGWGEGHTIRPNTAPSRLMPSRIFASLALPKLRRISLSGLVRAGSSA